MSSELHLEEGEVALLTPRKQRYSCRQDMLKDVRNMTSNGWMVEAITALAAGSYEVVFVQMK